MSYLPCFLALVLLGIVWADGSGQVAFQKRVCLIPRNYSWCILKARLISHVVSCFYQRVAEWSWEWAEQIKNITAPSMVMSSPAVLILALLSTLGEEFNMNRMNVAAFQPVLCSPVQAERRYESRLQDLRDRLEQSESTNRSMQNYVQFLKSSYDNVFRESALLGSPSRSRSPLWGRCSPCTFFKHTEGALFQSHIDIENRMAFQGHCWEIFFLQNEKIKLCWHMIKMWGISNTGLVLEAGVMP